MSKKAKKEKRKKVKYRNYMPNNEFKSLLKATDVQFEYKEKNE